MIEAYIAAAGAIVGAIVAALLVYFMNRAKPKILISSVSIYTPQPDIGETVALAKVLPEQNGTSFLETPASV